MKPDCATLVCENVGTVWGMFEMDGDVPQHVRYCAQCATYLFGEGLFLPDDLGALARRPQELSAAQEARLAFIEDAAPAPESFDSRAAVLRVLELANQLEGDGLGSVAVSIRRAVNGALVP